MAGPAANASKPRQRESKPPTPDGNELRDEIAMRLFVAIYSSNRSRTPGHIAELSIDAANDFIKILHR